MGELRVLPTKQAAINEDVVSVLEETLAMAQRGEIAAVAVAAVREDKLTASTRFSMSDCLPSLLGAVAIIQRRLTADCE